MRLQSDIAHWHASPCERLADAIDDFLGGNLERGIEAFALAHMERCPPCRVLARHALRYRETMRRVGEGCVAPRDFVEQLRFALRRDVEPPPH